MSDYENEIDKLKAHLEHLVSKHRQLDEYLETHFHNQNITTEVRRLKTEKLWLKDEIYRINRRIGELNGS